MNLYFENAEALAVGLAEVAPELDIVLTAKEDAQRGGTVIETK